MTTPEKITASEFDAFLAENANRRFELILGEIVEKMPTQLHDYIVHNAQKGFTCRSERAGDNLMIFRASAAAKR